MMRRRKITTEFVAYLAGMDTRTVNLFIQHQVYPFCEFAEAIKPEGSAYHKYSISPEKLREHFKYTDEEMQQFYDKKRAVS